MEIIYMQCYLNSSCFVQRAHTTISCTTPKVSLRPIQLFVASNTEAVREREIKSRTIRQKMPLRNFAVMSAMSFVFERL